MKFSVALCTYNGADYLLGQLESIAAQTRPPDELVICDDGSTDETEKIVEMFAARCAFPVRFFRNEKNLGPTQNFAKAIGLCAGETIALSDQDDIWQPTKLQRIEELFSAKPHLGLVFTDAEVVDEDLRPLGYRAWECDWLEFGQAEQRLFQTGHALDILLTRNIVTGATMAVRAKLRKLFLPIPEILVLHDHWIPLVVAAVSELAFIDEPLIKYRRHSQQHTGLMPPAGRTAAHEDRLNGSRRTYSIITPLLPALKQRLCEHNENGEYSDVISKLSHLQTRNRLLSSGIRFRLPATLRELLMLRYHRYSGGLKTALKDVMLAHDEQQFRA